MLSFVLDCKISKKYQFQLSHSLNRENCFRFNFQFAAQPVFHHLLSPMFQAVPTGGHTAPDGRGESQQDAAAAGLLLLQRGRRQQEPRVPRPRWAGEGRLQRPEGTRGRPDAAGQTPPASTARIPG